MLSPHLTHAFLIQGSSLEHGPQIRNVVETMRPHTMHAVGSRADTRLNEEISGCPCVLHVVMFKIIFVNIGRSLKQQMSN